jgi:hypothetical protein
MDCLVSYDVIEISETINIETATVRSGRPSELCHRIDGMALVERGVSPEVTSDHDDDNYGDHAVLRAG